MGAEWLTRGSGAARRDPITPAFDLHLTFQQPAHHLIMTPRSTKQSGLASLACTECRKQHLKCDARKPTCSRCLQNEYFCQYLPSRRGGRRKTREPNRRASFCPTDQINVKLSCASVLVNVNYANCLADISYCACYCAWST